MGTTMLSSNQILSGKLRQDHLNRHQLNRRPTSTKLLSKRALRRKAVPWTQGVGDHRKECVAGLARAEDAARNRNEVCSYELRRLLSLQIHDPGALFRALDGRDHRW